MTSDAQHTEEWRAVVGYEGRYEVSSLGRVRSLPRTERSAAGWSRAYPGVTLRQDTRRGYKAVFLCTGIAARQRRVQVHRLALEAFVGPCPRGMECCHGNGDRADNRAENLRWDTRRQNALQRTEHGTAPAGEAHHNTFITEECVRTIRSRVASGEQQRAVARDMGLGDSLVSNIVRRKTWRNVR